MLYGFSPQADGCSDFITHSLAVSCARSGKNLTSADVKGLANVAIHCLSESSDTSASRDT